MATRRTADEQRSPKATRQPEPEDEDLALAEELLLAAREEQAAVAAESRKFRKFLRQLGFRGKPIGAKKLRERLLRKGFDPAGNEFSRGIIAMREEETVSVHFSGPLTC
jgi:hypothetical protein